MRRYWGTPCMWLIASPLILVVFVNANTLDPTYEVLENTEVVWQTPVARPVRAVLLLAHGCSHSAVDFFPKSPKCPTCLGLSQELNITRTALSRGWAVLAISSADRRGNKCWRPSPPLVPPLEDTKNVKRVLQTWLAREAGSHRGSQSAGAADFTGNDKLGNTSSVSALEPSVPIYGLGASSGGAFILLLAMNGVAFAGVCSEVMAVPRMLLSTYINSQKAQGVSPVFPPTMFVHMTKDVRTARRVHMNMELLKAQGVPVKEAAIQPRPLTQAYLHAACGPEVTLEQSHAIHTALSAADYLSPEGMLKQDPRQSSWRKVLQDAQVPNFSSLRLQADASPISEELNLLWARHEIVSGTVGEMIDWFESLAHP